MRTRFSSKTWAGKMWRGFTKAGPGYPDTAYHRFIECLWRLPRPIIIFTIIAMFWWSVVDTTNFAKWAAAVSALPPQVWSVVMMVLCIFLGIKKLRGDLGGFQIDDDDDDGGQQPPPPAPGGQ